MFYLMLYLPIHGFLWTKLWILLHVSFLSIGWQKHPNKASCFIEFHIFWHFLLNVILKLFFCTKKKDLKIAYFFEQIFLSAIQAFESILKLCVHFLFLSHFLLLCRHVGSEFEVNSKRMIFWSNNLAKVLVIFTSIHAWMAKNNALDLITFWLNSRIFTCTVLREKTSFL